MQYFKNSELTKTYNVSFAAVGNWINASKKGKLDLQLHEAGGRHYIANTVKNLKLIDTMVRERKKYLNTRALKVVTPSPEFYKLYSPTQVVEIAASIDTYREIPLKYSYFDDGADYFDRYTKRLLNEETPNTLKETIELLAANRESLDRLLRGRKQVNVIDLGVGNALPVKGLLSHLLEKDVLGRYVAVDTSKGLLAIAEHNIKEWFGERVRFEGHIRDIAYDRFNDLLVDDSLDADDSLNLVLFLGGTLSNFRVPSDVLRTIYNSMSPGDLFVHSLKLDTPNSRRFFDVLFETQLRLPLDLLNVDPSWYEVERFFDEKQKARFIRVRLTVALSITFELGNGQRCLEFNKGETILIGRYWHQNALDVFSQLDRTGFNLLQASITQGHEYILTVSEIKTGTNGQGSYESSTP